MRKLLLKVLTFFKTLSNPKVVKVHSRLEDVTESYRAFIKLAITTQTAIIGFKPFDRSYKFNFLNALIAFDIIFYIVVNAYDIKIFWGPLKDVCFCMVTWSFGFTGAMLLYTLITKQPLICNLLDRVFGISLKFNLESNEEEIETYKKYGRILNKIAPYSIVYNRICGFVAAFYPVVIYLYTGKAILPFGFAIPGISYTKNPGYAINYAFQILQSVLTTSALMEATLHIFMLFIAGAFCQIDVICIKIKKLNALLNNETTNNVENVTDKLLEIIDLHQNYQEFLQLLEQLYSNLYFVNLSFYTFQNVITLFVLADQFWVEGYVFVMVLLTLIFIPCAFGSLLEMRNDHLINEIYGINWYFMKGHQRITVTFLLNGAQNMRLLTFGGYFPLNFATFKNTYAKIYSYLMFLIDVQD